VEKLMEQAALLKEKNNEKDYIITKNASDLRQLQSQRKREGDKYVFYSFFVDCVKGTFSAGLGLLICSFYIIKQYFL
jgi:hypothetical protein